MGRMGASLAMTMAMAAFGCAAEVDLYGGATAALAPVPPGASGGFGASPLACNFDYEEVERSTMLCTYTGPAELQEFWLDAAQTSCSEYWSTRNDVRYKRYSVACNVK